MERPVERRTGLALLVLCLLLLLPPAVRAGAPCRIAFDMGSSGIRAGSDASPRVERVHIDFLAPQWDGRGLAVTLPATLAALRDLPAAGAFPRDCAKVGGGFSAWRLALRRDPSALTSLLRRLHAESGVAVLVMPQAREGHYGYRAARAVLGARLVTSHVLDLGGGSLEVAGARSSWGSGLGQQTWHRALCRALRGTDSCTLQPLQTGELARARAAAAHAFTGLRRALPGAVTLTAISAPLSRGILPALQALPGAERDVPQLQRAQLGRALEGLAPLLPEASGALTGTAPRFRDTLISDMVLVEGLMRALGLDTLEVAEASLDNIPGLLADDQAYAWSAHYACYLDRLGAQGIAAFDSDPARCPR